MAAADNIIFCKVSSKTARNQTPFWRLWLGKDLNLICPFAFTTKTRVSVLQSVSSSCRTGRKYWRSAALCWQEHTLNSACFLSWIRRNAIFSFLCSQLDSWSNSLKISRAQGTLMINLKGPRVAGFLEEEVSADNTLTFMLLSDLSLLPQQHLSSHLSLVAWKGVYIKVRSN